MENKEIREKVTQDKPIKQDRFANGIRTLINESPLINAIQNATRADERERVISEIEKMLGPKLVTLYQSELAIENYKSEFRAKLNSLKP